MIGRTVSHFKILERIGAGGMGVVYKAEDTDLKRTVALKFLPPELMRDSNARTRFIHEARAAAAVHHTNICTVYEVGEADGQVFIAMAYLEGQSLKDRLAEGALDIKDALDIASQVAEGLKRAHAQGIVHRDIKPGNIMLIAEGAAVLMDFGLAKSVAQTKVTKSGTTVGTVAYMSPEQARGVDVDPRTDIWSLGVTLHEMITGRLPFRGDVEQAMVYSIMNEEPASISKLCPDVPRKIEEIIVRALEKCPDDRFPDASALVDALHEVLRLLESESKLPRGRRVLSKRARRKRRWITAGVTAVITIAALFTIHRVTVEKAVESPAIAVVPLVSIAGDDEIEQMTRMVARMLTTDLGESNHIRVLGSAALRQILLNRRLQANSEFTTEDFNGIARSADLSHIVTLSLFRGGATLRTDIEILDTSSGQVVATAGEEAAGVDNLVQMIDPLATKTREALLSRNQLASEQDRPFGDITSNSPEAVTLFYQAQEYEEQANSAGAIALYDRVLELDPDFFLARLWRELHVEGQMAFFEANNIERLSAYERLMLESQRALSTGDFPKMLQVANQILALRPSNWASVRSKYEAQYFMGLYEEAVQTCEWAIRNGYRTYNEHLILNSAYAMSGLDANERRERYITLLDEDPSDAMMKFWLAVTFLILNKDAEAEDLLDIVFEIYPDNDAFMRVLSDTYTWRESPDKGADYERALAYIDRMRELKIAYDDEGALPDDLSTYDWLYWGIPISFMVGEIYFLEGQPDKAIAAYERSLALKENHYNSFYRLGLAYEQIGQADKAIANFEKYVRVTELNAYDASALGREAGCAATRTCHSISRPEAVADATQRIERLQ